MVEQESQREIQHLGTDGNVVQWVGEEEHQSRRKYITGSIRSLVFSPNLSIDQPFCISLKPNEV